MKRKAAIFVTLEGIEGAGKSTQAKLLKKHFEAKGLKVLLTREPGGTKLGNEVRDVVLRKRPEPLDALTELFLIEAARAQHVAEILKPALSQYDLILCDRFSDATLAYQGGGRGLDLAWLKELNLHATQELQPDLTLLFDMPLTPALRRARARFSGKAEDEDRFENEQDQFHERVRKTYLRLAKEEPNRFIVVQAAGPIKKVAQNIGSRLEGWLEKQT